MSFSLYDLLPDAIPYPIKSGIVRGIRTGIAAVLAGVSAAIADGSLLGVVQIIPPAYFPAATMALTTLFVAVDKWLRERGLVEDAKEAGLIPPDAKELPQALPVDADKVEEAKPDNV
jgi:hypothetical protein